MKAIKFNGQITGIRSKVDGSLGLTLATPELDTKEKIAVMELQNVNSNITVIPQDVKSPDMVKVKQELDSKTPSQRLRGVLFIWWKQSGEQGQFEDFYRNKMEEFINYIKQEKLED